MRKSSLPSSFSLSSFVPKKYLPFALIFFLFTILNLLLIVINEVQQSSNVNLRKQKNSIIDSSFQQNLIHSEQSEKQKPQQQYSRSTRTLSSNPQLTSIQSKQNQKHPMKCLSFQNEFDKLIQSTRQIFITMPAKAAGTSLGSFVTDKCLKSKYSNSGFDESMYGHYFNREESLQQMIASKYEIPQIMSSHLGRKELNALEQLIKSATDDSMILYVHRKETDRVLSGIKQVVDKVCSDKASDHIGLEKYRDRIRKESLKNNEDDGSNNKNCIIHENILLEMVQNMEQEIGNGVYRALTCNVFDAIEANQPNMLILNYKQADELQKVLAKHHCPELLKDGSVPVHVNEVSKKEKIWYVRLSSDESRKVPLEEWVEVKRHVIEWAFGMKKDVGCQRKIKNMEKMLFACDDELIQFL